MSTFEVDFEAVDDSEAERHAADLARRANVPRSSEITIERPNGTKLRLVSEWDAEA